MALVLLVRLAAGAELHVATSGGDMQPGTEAAPLRTIQRAAALARPGDVVTVHAGVYRERIDPPRGGRSDAERIVFRSAPGDVVEIKGSEVVTGWERVAQGNGVWKAEISNALFGEFNPYAAPIRGDWFDGRGREHHRGAVYLDGHWLTEATSLAEVLLPKDEIPSWFAEARERHATDVTGGNLDTDWDARLWFARVEETKTTIWARFGAVNPNEALVEINVRPAVFYPSRPGRGFITVRGFRMGHAATDWAPPTSEQIGLVGTHWSRGWIIEDNVIHHSVCTGVTLGKHGDEFDNTSADTAEGYVKTIERAHAFAIPWTRETIGHHVVRRNTISHCEQAGIVGSLGAAFSTVEDNHIHDIHIRRLFTGAEMAGVKFHAPIDTVIRGNRIHRTTRGIWLDWMTQGTRVTRNLLHDNITEDLFLEVNHGPFVVDHNVLLSRCSVRDMSEGGAFVHNLFAGTIRVRPEPLRETPFHPAHSTQVAGLAVTRCGDDRFLANLFVGDGRTPPAKPARGLEDLEWIEGFGLSGYGPREMPIQAAGNVYLRGARPHAGEVDALVAPDVDPMLRLEVAAGRVNLRAAFGAVLERAKSTSPSLGLSGRTQVSGLPWEERDGSALDIGADWFGRRRGADTPTPGPFEALEDETVVLGAW